MEYCHLDKGQLCIVIIHYQLVLHSLGSDADVDDDDNDAGEEELEEEEEDREAKKTLW